MITTEITFPTDVYEAQEDLETLEEYVGELQGLYDVRGEESVSLSTVQEETYERLPVIAERYQDLSEQCRDFQSAYPGLELLSGDVSESLEAIDEFEDRFYDVKAKQDRLSNETELVAGRRVEDYTGPKRHVTNAKDAIAATDNKTLALGSVAALSAAGVGYAYANRDE